MKKLKNIIYIFAFILYEEIAFSILTIGNFENSGLKLIFIILISLIINIIVTLFKDRNRKIMTNIILGILTVIYIVYYIYYKIFLNTLSIYSILHGARCYKIHKCNCK